MRQETIESDHEPTSSSVPTVKRRGGQGGGVLP